MYKRQPENIIRVLDEFFSANGELQGKKIMITAGPTYEKIDPVRFIGNYSSGKIDVYKRQHQDLEEALAVAQRIRAKKTYFIHMSHDMLSLIHI